ncbi:hypothetical protein GS597_19570 [Synechococcales cyanobacterium C]|uniref:Cyanobacterial aminoacyl-tRNA synthetase CAAD domain-containing protein n=1 Tax=Petrachloros mirabilis ULC683 TaxID=2781853 RepID=A0A8K2A9V7_9CYAN|nr:CAAD domain-containing protein [Petrachloros mirabilis]NCJ08664.1 hypothetical protein [Petrachloros mirabilis ULC683]
MSPNVDTSLETDTIRQPIAETDAPDQLDVNPDAPGTLFKLPSQDLSLASEKWQEYGEKLARFLILFPDYLGEAFGQYRKPLTTVGIIAGAGVTLAIADGVLDRLNAIPLFAPTFELIGLGFTGWVIFRYLLYADTRQELWQEYQELKDRITGQEDENSEA